MQQAVKQSVTCAHTSQLPILPHPQALSLKGLREFREGGTVGECGVLAVCKGT